MIRKSLYLQSLISSLVSPFSSLQGCIGLSLVQVPAVEGRHTTNGLDFLASSSQSIAVRAVAEKDTAVFATSNTGIGIDARSKSGIGVYGKGGSYTGYYPCFWHWFPTGSFLSSLRELWSIPGFYEKRLRARKANKHASDRVHTWNRETSHSEPDFFA